MYPYKTYWQRAFHTDPIVPQRTVLSPFHTLSPDQFRCVRHFPSTRQMNVYSVPPHLQSLFDNAIEKYKKQEGSALIENQLVALRTCNSVESVAAVLEERAQAFREFLGHDRHKKMLKSIKRVVHVFHTAFTALGGAVQVGHGVGSVVRLMLPI
jgi:hypothetical protein